MRAAALLAVAVLVGAGCGDDDEDAGGASGSASETEEETTTTAGEEEGGEEGGDGGDNAELCALAEEIFSQEDFPSAAQIERYQELAPEEIADAVETAGAPFIEHGGDPVATFAAFAEDDVEAALEEINAFEEEECGVPHSEDAPPEGVTTEVEDDAAQVQVIATDYAFEIPGPVSAGRTSFIMRNDGAEAHFMVLTRVLQGTLDEALAFEGDAEAEGLVEDVGDSNIAAPGGDEEVLTVDLEPGDYGLLCFVPGPDGTPHAFMGMVLEFTVA